MDNHHHSTVIGPLHETNKMPSQTKMANKVTSLVITNSKGGFFSRNLTQGSCQLYISDDRIFLRLLFMKLMNSLGLNQHRYAKGRVRESPTTEKRVPSGFIGAPLSFRIVTEVDPL
jgi:lysyl-tRNA synthetase class II